MKTSLKNRKPKARGNFSFFRYFNPQKSPHAQMNPHTGAYEYYPKNDKSRGVVVWDSRRKGTYVRSIHGELTKKK